MDSLQVGSTHQSGNSKASSRSTSPCRARSSSTNIAAASGGGAQSNSTTTTPSEQQQGSGEKEKSFHPHHVKTLSHGSAESAKVFPSKHPHRHFHHFSSPNFFMAQSQDATTAAAAAASSSSHASRSSRHKSPTQLIRGHAPPMDHTPHHSGLTESSFLLDDSGTLIANLSQDGDVSGQDLCSSSFLSNGDNKEGDETDGVLDSKTNAIVEHLVNKIIRVRDLIRTEQKLRDDNVNEYLKLAANADKQQQQRLKAVFEKKNQKSAQAISQLQKKLDMYQKKLQGLREHGIQSHRLPREVLRDMGQGLKHVGGNIRDGITGFSGSVMSKPREFAHLIKNKFGSADNISQFSTWYVGAAQSAVNQTTTGSEGSYTGAAEGGANEDGHTTHHHKMGGAKHGSATLPMTASQSSMQAAGGGSGGGGGTTAVQKQFPSDDGSECESSVTSDSIGRYGLTEGLSLQDNFAELNKKLKYIQEELESYRESQDIIKSLQAEVQFLNSSIQEDRFKSERLEEQINDLTELHQNEVENLKQAMADMEEKVQYQSEERLRDIHEMLEHCQTKIQKMEHQALQQQQYVMLEGIDNSNARALVVKLINVLLTVLQVVLLLVATGAGIIMPFLRTRVRIITTLVFVIAIVFTLKQWPEVQDIGSHVMKRLKDTLDPVQ